MLRSCKARLLEAALLRFTAGFIFFTLSTLSPALADDVGDIIVSLDYNTARLPYLFELLAYISGIFCLYSGVMALKDSSQKPLEKPLRPAIVRFIIAALLIALPKTIIMVSKSIGVDDAAATPALTRTKMFDN